MAQPYLGLGTGGSWLSRGGPFLSFAQIAVCTEMLCFRFHCLCDYTLAAIPTSSVCSSICLQYANTEGEGLGDLVTCSYIR